MLLPSPVHCPVRAGSERGFTVAEMIIVVAIVGLMVAAAAPSFMLWVKDGRVMDCAQAIADIYRTARSRAMGRGSAMGVRWDATAAMPTDAAPWGQLSLIEATVGAGGGVLDPNVAMASCLTRNFTLAPNPSVTGTRFVGAVEPRYSRYAPAVAEFQDSLGSAVGQAVVCYTPSGRVWYREGADPWERLAEVPGIQVTNSDSQMARHVLLPPTGAARLVLRVQ